MYVCKPSVVSHVKALSAGSVVVDEKSRLNSEPVSLWANIMQSILQFVIGRGVHFCAALFFGNSVLHPDWTHPYKTLSFIPLSLCPDFPSDAPSYAPRKQPFLTLCPHSSLNKKGWFILFRGKQIRHFDKTLLWNMNKGEMRRKQRKIINFLPDPIKGGILVLAHWSVSDDLSHQHLFPITPLFHYHISHRLNGVWAKIWIQRGNRRLISPPPVPPSSWRNKEDYWQSGIIKQQRKQRRRSEEVVILCLRGQRRLLPLEQAERRHRKGLMPPARRAFTMWHFYHVAALSAVPLREGVGGGGWLIMNREKIASKVSLTVVKEGNLALWKCTIARLSSCSFHLSALIYYVTYTVTIR